MPRILCVEDDPTTVRQLEALLRRLGYEVAFVRRLFEAREALLRQSVDLVLVAGRLPDGDGLDLLDDLGEAPVTPIVVMATFGSEEEALAARQQGATDVIPRPLREETARFVVRHAIEAGRLRRENRELRNNISALRGDGAVVGQSPEFRSVLDMLDPAANTRATILLEGESGTGKKLLARAAHDRSPRRDGPLVRVPVAATSVAHQEKVLFGAHGALERADQGTLLLDEIGELTLGLQARLLHAIQNQEFERGPGARPVACDVRLILTTSHDLREATSAGRFDRDLYFRISNLTIRTPPLRARLDDLPDLVSHFAERAAEALGIRRLAIPPETLEHLREHRWPGNVRELENAVERAVILCREGELRPGAFDLRDSVPSFVAGERREVLDIATLKMRTLRRALVVCDGNRSRAAAMLGISERTLRNMLQKEKALGKPARDGDVDRRPRGPGRPRPTP